jgi:hypothetical protein
MQKIVTSSQFCSNSLAFNQERNYKLFGEIQDVTYFSTGGIAFA